MAYTLAPFNPSTPYQNQVATELNTANTNFTILGQAFYNNDPTSNPVLRASYIGSSAPSNPVAGMTWLDTSSNPPVLKVYDGNSWRLMAPLNSSGILDLSNTYVKSNVYTFRRVDLTNASSDYFLQVGEEAIINYNNTQNVALHIATQSGTYYEIFISNNANPTYLYPNNTSYSNQFIYTRLFVYKNNSSYTVGDEGGTVSGFGFFGTSNKIIVSNITAYKRVFAYYDDGSNSHTGISSSYWNDTSTNWTSLGTFNFNWSVSGYILVRRLA